MRRTPQNTQEALVATKDIIGQARSLAVTARDRVIGRRSATEMRRRGLVHGERLHLGPGSYVDDDFAWLIEMGDDVTLAPNCTVIAHDASTRMHTGYTRMAPVRIGSRVFLGAGTTVLPGVTIGDDVVVGAGSVVTKDIPSGSLAVGAPARVVGPLADYLANREERRSRVRTFASNPFHDPGFGAAEATQMRRELGRDGAYLP